MPRVLLRKVLLIGVETAYERQGLLKSTWRGSCRFLHCGSFGRVEDMRDAGGVFPTAKGGCHTLWLLGHLAYSEQNIIQCMMLGEEDQLEDWSKLFSHATEPADDVSKYPPFDEVLAKCREVRESTLALLDSMTEEDLDKPSAKIPEGYEKTFGTYRLCFQFAVIEIAHKFIIARAKKREMVVLKPLQEVRHLLKVRGVRIRRRTRF